MSSVSSNSSSQEKIAEEKKDPLFSPKDIEDMAEYVDAREYFTNKYVFIKYKDLIPKLTTEQLYRLLFYEEARINKIVENLTPLKKDEMLKVICDDDYIFSTQF